MRDALASIRAFWRDYWLGIALALGAYEDLQSQREAALHRAQDEADRRRRSATPRAAVREEPRPAAHRAQPNATTLHAANVRGVAEGGEIR